jgi:dynein light intermediate chain
MSKALLSESLVKYETPILVSSAYQSVNAGQATGKAKLPPVSKTSFENPQARTEDYLNKILPPQETIDNNQLWVRYVSGTPATSVDVENLTNNLNKRLASMGARDCGICTVREELFSQCFDELIRQITINCSERGYLLVRVRDEFRMYK